MASVSKPQHPPSGRKIKSFAREKFVSANIGRSKRLALYQAPSPRARVREEIIEEFRAGSMHSCVQVGHEIVDAESGMKRSGVPSDVSI